MNQTFKTIKDGKKVLALIFLNKKRPKGLCFPTPKEFTLQIGWHNQGEKREVSLHRHPPLKYKVAVTSEFLYVEKGWLEIEITNNKWRKIENLKLLKGDSILIVDGGHKITIGSKSSILEVKQGPYPGETKSKIYK